MAANRANMRALMPPFLRSGFGRAGAVRGDQAPRPAAKVLGGTIRDMAFRPFGRFLIIGILLCTPFIAWFIAEQVQPPVKRVALSWTSPLLGRDIRVEALYPPHKAGQQKTVVYIQGVTVPGVLPDQGAISTFLNRGFMVLTIDYEDDQKAVPPELEKDLHRFYRAIMDREGVLSGLPVRPHFARVFFVPEGFRIEEDLSYFHLLEHAPSRLADYIVETFNEHVAPNADLKPVSDVSQLRDRSGRHLDFNLRMDVIYPARVATPVPVIMVNSELPNRPPSLSHKQDKWHGIGIPLRGYAYAVVDHPYNPVWRAYWNYFKKYSLNGFIGPHTATASVRTIRAHAARFNIDPRYVGIIGHSKGQYGVTRLSDRNHPNESEYDPAYRDGWPDQPYPNESSQITVGYQSMGWGLYVGAPFIDDPDYAPTYLAQGEDDPHLNRYRMFRDHLIALDINLFSQVLEGIGHALPQGIDPEDGADEYLRFWSFFDSYLRPELPPVLLDITPELGLHFAPPIDPSSLDAITVYQNGRAIPGEWTIKRQGALLVFDQPLPPDCSIEIRPTLRDTDGTAYGKTANLPCTRRGVTFDFMSARN